MFDFFFTIFLTFQRYNIIIVLLSNFFIFLKILVGLGFIQNLFSLVNCLLHLLHYIGCVFKKIIYKIDPHFTSIHPHPQRACSRISCNMT